MKNLLCILLWILLGVLDLCGASFGQSVAFQGAAAIRPAAGGGGGSAPTFVQVSAGDDNTGLQLAMGSNVGNGNVLVTGVCWLPNTVSLTGVTSDRSAAFTLLDNPTAETGNNGRMAMAVAATTSSGSCTITYTFSGAVSSIGYIAHEYSGVDTTTPVDNSGAAHEITDAQNLGTDADAYTSGTFTTTTANCKIVGFCFDVNIGGHIATGTGFTGRQTTEATGRGESEDKTLASAGTTAATFTSDYTFLSAIVGGVGLKPQ